MPLVNQRGVDVEFTFRLKFVVGVKEKVPEPPEADRVEPVRVRLEPIVSVLRLLVDPLSPQRIPAGVVVPVPP